MAIAEARANRIVADNIPASDGYTGKFLRSVATVLVAKNIFFADVLRAGRVLTQELAGKIALAVILPNDAKVGADELDIGWLCHEVESCLLFAAGLKQPLTKQRYPSTHL